MSAGTSSAGVLTAAAANSSTLVVDKTTYTTNDILLLQNTAETVLPVTVSYNTITTNKLITFHNPIGTNLAVGDVLRERGTQAYKIIAPAAAAATSILVDRTNGLAANDLLVLHPRGGGNLTNVVLTGGASASRKTVNLKVPVLKPVTIGDAVYEQLTNYCLMLGTNAVDGVNLHAGPTNNFAAAELVLVDDNVGNLFIGTIASVTATNVELAVAPGFALAVGCRITKLHATSYTATLPADVGDKSLVLSASTALAANDVLVIASTGFQPWLSVMNGAAVSKTVYTLTLANAFLVPVDIGDEIYEASLTTLTTTWAATATSSSVICNVATGVAAHDQVYIIPASGGCFMRQAAAAAVDYPLSTLTLSGQIGLIMSVGNQAWLMGSETVFTVGNATVRRDSTALYAADQGRPVRVRQSGAAACAINSVTGIYQ
jgi:hypothetical protein